MSGRAELGAVGQLQAEMLHLDLIDGADGFRGDLESSKPSTIAAPVLLKDPAAPVTMDTYRPKRPTTLNLFPIVPRTQVGPGQPRRITMIDLIDLIDGWVDLIGRCVRSTLGAFGGVFECVIQFKSERDPVSGQRSAIGCDYNRCSDWLFTGGGNKSASCRGPETEDVGFFFSSSVVHLRSLELVTEARR